MWEMFSKDQLTEYDNTISYLKNLVIESINDYAINKNLESIDDITKFSQSKWYAVLMYVANSCMIPNNRLLKADKPYINILGVKSNNYNLYILDGLYNIYSYLCNEYDKGITPYGYSLFLGLDYYNFTCIMGDDDGMEGGKLSNIKSYIYKKVYAAYEQSAEAKLWTNKNPVAVMAITNRRFGWNMPGVGRDSRGRSALGAVDLPQLDEKP